MTGDEKTSVSSYSVYNRKTQGNKTAKSTYTAPSAALVQAENWECQMHGSIRQRWIVPYEKTITEQSLAKPYVKVLMNVRICD